ncbi:hypothetical protein [Planctomicrobium sp. SH527]|uniref:hypothetical protein n=1 Tax=Planctomicrobium sp. SH527 TaxID=3448123 RepID=UPI003F5BD42B
MPARWPDCLLPEPKVSTLATKRHYPPKAKQIRVARSNGTSQQQLRKTAAFTGKIPDSKNPTTFNESINSS